IVAVMAYLTTSQALTQEREQRGIAEGERERARNAERDAEKARALAVAQRDVTTSNLYVAHMRLGYEALQHRQIAQVTELLDLYRPEPPLHHLTGWEWCYLRSACREEVVRTVRGFDPRAVAWHPDGHELAIACGDGTVRILKYGTGAELHCLRGHQGPVQALAYSSDGRWLVSGGEDGSVKIWNPATGALLSSGITHAGPVVGVAPRAEKQCVASVSSDGTLQ